MSNKGRKGAGSGRSSAWRSLAGKVGVQARRVALPRRGSGRRRAPTASTPQNGDVLQADLRGFNEVPPVVSSGTGTFRGRVAPDGMSIEYELSYANLTSEATAARVHFGHPSGDGGVMVVLCGGDDRPACPGRGGTLAGQIVSDDVLAVPEQGLAAGDLASVLTILRSGLAYLNVPTGTFPAGEIRGQIRAS